MVQEAASKIKLVVEEDEEKVQTHRLAMTVMVVSWSMLFATLLLGYFTYRYSQSTWPPLGIQAIPLVMPNLCLAFVLTSSVTFYFAVRWLAQGKTKNMRLALWATLFLGLSYMFCQYAFWQQLNSLDLYSSSNIFASILHGFTWIHAGHMVLAYLAVIMVLFRTRRDVVAIKSTVLVGNVGIFWHFLTIVWVLLYLVLFVI